MKASIGYPNTHSSSHRQTYHYKRFMKVCLVMVAVLTLSSTMYAQIAIDAVSSGTSNTTSLNFSHIIGGGADRLLVLSIAVEGSSPTNSDVTEIPTYNGITFTKAIDNITGISLGMNAELWYMLEAQLPVAGTYTVSITTAAASNISAGSVSVTGVEQQAPEVTGSNDDGQSGARTIQTTVTTLTDNAWLFDCVGSGNTITGFTPDAGQIERWDVLALSSRGAGSTKVNPTAGQVTLGWTAESTSNRITHVVAAFIPVMGCITDNDCDDINQCTLDACNAGTCQHNPVTNGTTCNDGDVCNTGETCQTGVCTGGGPQDCSGAGDQCNIASCDVAGVEGNCATLTQVLDGTSCDDSVACNTGETCQTGVCSGGAPPDCSGAGDQCNTASCDPFGLDGNCDTITPVLNGTICDDTNACNTGETCQTGVCTGGAPTDCAGTGDQCNADNICNPAGLEGNCDTIGGTINEGLACDNSNACNVGETCQLGVCTGSVPTDCAGTGDQCNADNTCNPAGLEGNCDTIGGTINEGLPCDDSIACNVGETCQIGVCVGGAPQDCSNAGDQCNTASCDVLGAEGNCNTLTPVLDGTTCDDSDACNTGESCQLGVCLGGAPPDCSGAGDQCNTASCDLAGIDGNCDTFTPILDGTTCDDTLFCTSVDTCSGGICVGSGSVCLAGEFCDEPTDTCIADINVLALNVSPGSITVAPGDTVVVTLDVSSLTGPINGVQVLLQYDTTILSLTNIVPTDLGLILPDEGWVEIDEIDNAGDITWAAVITGDSLFLNDTIATIFFTAIAEGTTNVTFRPDEPPVLNKLTSAIDGSTIPSARVDSGPIVSTCDDGLFCNGVEPFVAGTCQPGSDPCLGLGCDEVNDVCTGCITNAKCEDFNPCTDDVCNAGTCENNNNTASCDDGDACTVGDICSGGSCLSGAPPDCSGAGDQCNTASCDVAGAQGNCDTLTPANEGLFCDDGLACNVDETCQTGVCTGGAPPDCSGVGDQCNVAICDPVGLEGNCNTIAPALDGTTCDDGVSCTDAVCQTGSCIFSSHSGQVTVDLQVEAVSNAITRDVTFNMTTCSGGVATQVIPVSLDATGQATGVNAVVISGVDVNATWIAAQEGHTLRRLAPLTFVSCGATVDMTGLTRLIAGDFQTGVVIAQDNLVDITDFSVLASNFNQSIDPALSTGADVTADGLLGIADFTTLQVNFFTVGEAVDSCPLTAINIGGEFERLNYDPDSVTTIQPVGRIRISVNRLYTDNERRADLNHDGLIDFRDIREFARRHNLPLLPDFVRKMKRLETNNNRHKR